MRSTRLPIAITSLSNALGELPDVSGISVSQLEQAVNPILGQHRPFQELLVTPRELFMIGTLPLSKFLENSFDAV